VFDAAWHDEQVALPKLHRAVAEFDLEIALEHQEEIVGVRVAVPDELALDLYHFDLVVVCLASHSRQRGLRHACQLAARRRPRGDPTGATSSRGVALIVAASTGTMSTTHLPHGLGRVLAGRSRSQPVRESRKCLL
jgi:hypothetical protein